MVLNQIFHTDKALFQGNSLSQFYYFHFSFLCPPHLWPLMGLGENKEKWSYKKFSPFNDKFRFCIKMLQSVRGPVLCARTQDLIFT